MQVYSKSENIIMVKVRQQQVKISCFWGYLLIIFF